MYWRSPTSMSTCGIAPRTAQRLLGSYDMRPPCTSLRVLPCASYWDKAKGIQCRVGGGPRGPSGRAASGLAPPGRIAGALAADDDVTVVVDARQFILRQGAQQGLDRAERLVEALPQLLGGILRL